MKIFIPCYSIFKYHAFFLGNNLLPVVISKPQGPCAWILFSVTFLCYIKHRKIATLNISSHGVVYQPNCFASY